jgi:hypothetical protein
MRSSPIKGPKSGRCQLTGERGAYVKSHIIPAALTRLPSNGKKIVEAGIGLGVKSRFVGWYDNELVTRVGEDILEEIDTPAIEILRSHKLIWSSWAEEELPANDYAHQSEPLAFRFLDILRAKELHLFFLSLVWRSAASRRPELSEVQLPTHVLEDLRSRVHEKDSRSFDDYPVQLFQIVTKGILHNRAPLLEKSVVELETGGRHEVEYVRIYFDGLVARVHLALRESFDERYLATCLRSGDKTMVFTHEFDRSRTAADIKEMVTTVVKESAQPPVQLTAISEVVRRGRKT